jgi:hypothetical protein
MGFLETVWDVFWFTFWLTALFAYIFLLATIIMDIFRDRELGGGMKALWLVLLIFFPVITGLVYLIVRGKGMSERRAAEMAKAQESTEQYIRDVAASSPTDELAKAKKMHADGVIDDAEYAALKTKILAS